MHNRTWTGPAVLAAMIAVTGSGVCRANPPTEALSNVSFESGTGSAPSGWAAHVWSGKAAFSWAQAGRTGGRSVRIASAEGGDASWRFTAKVLPDSVYRLSGWIRTDGVKASTGRGAQLNVHQISGARTPAVIGTADWRKVTC